MSSVSIEVGLWKCCSLHKSLHECSNSFGKGSLTTWFERNQRPSTMIKKRNASKESPKPITSSGMRSGIKNSITRRNHRLYSLRPQKFFPLFLFFLHDDTCMSPIPVCSSAGISANSSSSYSIESFLKYTSSSELFSRAIELQPAG
jgi:hypothetical protein